MALIVLPNTFTVGQTIVASAHNTNFNTIYSDYNGNIDNTNIAALAAIADTKLAQITTAGKVSSTSITGLIAAVSVFPAGMIVLWSGTIATIPSGWVLCNGSNSTPDLRNRFIVAADADDSGAAKSTITGSALQTSDGQIPAHTHTVPAQDDGGVVSHTSVRTGNNTSTFNVSTSSSGTGTYNIAKFYALAYIMKT